MNKFIVLFSLEIWVFVQKKTTLYFIIIAYKGKNYPNWASYFFDYIMETNMGLKIAKYSKIDWNRIFINTKSGW